VTFADAAEPSTTQRPRRARQEAENSAPSSPAPTRDEELRRAPASSNAHQGRQGNPQVNGPNQTRTPRRHRMRPALPDLHLDEVPLAGRSRRVRRNAFEQADRNHAPREWAHGFLDLTANYLASHELHRAIRVPRRRQFFSGPSPTVIEPTKTPCSGRCCTGPTTYAALDYAEGFQVVARPVHPRDHRRMTEPQGRRRPRQRRLAPVPPPSPNGSPADPESRSRRADCMQQLVHVQEQVHLLAAGDEVRVLRWQRRRPDLVADRARPGEETGPLRVRRWGPRPLAPADDHSRPRGQRVAEGFDGAAANILERPTERAQQALWIVARTGMASAGPASTATTAKPRVGERWHWCSKCNMPIEAGEKIHETRTGGTAPRQMLRVRRSAEGAALVPVIYQEAHDGWCWKQTAERAVKSAAQAVVLLLGAGQVTERVGRSRRNAGFAVGTAALSVATSPSHGLVTRNSRHSSTDRRRRRPGRATCPPFPSPIGVGRAAFSSRVGCRRSRWRRGDVATTPGRVVVVVVVVRSQRRQTHDRPRTTTPGRTTRR